MTIKQLKELIQELPDDVLLLVNGRDHSYNLADVRESTVLAAYDDPRYLYEDYGDENKDNEKDRRVSALIIS